MARPALGCLLVLLASPARAGVAVDDGVPFTAPELTEALELRSAPTGEVTVHAIAPTIVELRTAIGRQRVDLGAARGAAAARLVALQLAPLGVEPQLTASFGPGLAPGLVAAAPPPDAAPRVAALPQWHLAVTAGGGRGTSALDFGLFALRADAVQHRGALRWGGSLGWLHGLARSPDAMDPATADFAIARLGAGLGSSTVELLAGPELVAYRATAASPGVTAGVGAAVRFHLIDGARWHAFASADLDAFRHRVQIDRAGVAFATTPRVALTAAIGVAWSAP